MLPSSKSCWMMLPLLVYLQSVVQAGNSCLQGIVGCTQSMRKRDLAEVSVKHPCRILSDYTDCLGEACKTHPVTCEVQRARHQMFQLMASNGIQCETASSPEEPGYACSLTSSSSSLSSPSSSSFRSHPISSSIKSLFSLSLYCLLLSLTFNFPMIPSVTFDFL